MRLDIQYKLKENKGLLEYLHTHSYWYKYLNRDNNFYNSLLNEYKEFMRTTKMNRASELMNTIEMITTIVNTLN